MEAIKFLKMKARMCDEYDGCRGCPLSSYDNVREMSCRKYADNYPEKTIKIVEEWDKANPEETLKSVFLKNYPNARLSDNGNPLGCPYHLYKEMDSGCFGGSCTACWSRPASLLEEAD